IFIASIGDIKLTMGFMVTSLIFSVVGIIASLCTRICFNRGPSTNLYAPPDVGRYCNSLLLDDGKEVKGKLEHSELKPMTEKGRYRGEGRRGKIEENNETGEEEATDTKKLFSIANLYKMLIRGIVWTEHLFLGSISIHVIFMNRLLSRNDFSFNFISLHIFFAWCRWAIVYLAQMKPLIVPILSEGE
ncbi:hypothetical protein C3L33_11551, partial [Rhododendron williamsianum]